MHPRRLPLLLSLACAAALIAACNSASGTAAPGATTAATAATSAAPGATQAASQAPGATADVGGSAAGLAHLQSYKFSLKTTGKAPTNVEATIVNGATPAKMYTETTGNVTFRVIEIGTDVWVDQGTGTYVKNAMPMTAVDALTAVFDPALIMANLQKNPASGYLQGAGTEQKNGVNCTHLHADSTTPVPAGASPIPAGTVFDVWVAVDGGYLVALEGSGLGNTGSNADTIQLEVTNVNDPSLTVTPPA
jgi:hypothetical protein